MLWRILNFSFRRGRGGLRRPVADLDDFAWNSPRLFGFREAHRRGDSKVWDTGRGGRFCDQSFRRFGDGRNDKYKNASPITSTAQAISGCMACRYCSIVWPDWGEKICGKALERFWPKASRSAECQSRRRIRCMIALRMVRANPRRAVPTLLPMQQAAAPEA